jgi:hypothetical protein
MCRHYKHHSANAVREIFDVVLTTVYKTKYYNVTLRRVRITIVAVEKQ